MNLYPIFEEIMFDSICSWRMEKMRSVFKLDDDTNWLFVYHGTSEANAKNIIKTKLNNGTWLTDDYSTAELYANRQAHGGKPYVMSFNVFIGSCLPSGDHITTQEDLYMTSKGFVPKSLLNKYHKI